MNKNKNIQKKSRQVNKQKINKRGKRGQKQNNPLVNRASGVRGAIGQVLTQTQFTATSPLNLFSIVGGSTPGGVRVKGRELISSVALTSTSTGAFQIATLPDLPGGSGTFAYLNPFSFQRLQSYGNIYEEFIFHNCTCILQSSQPTTAAGEWMIVCDYDASDANLTSTAAMMRLISSSMANIYSDMSMVTEKSLSAYPKYFCSENGTATAQLMQINQGKIEIGIEGYTGTSGGKVGYLVCEYDVEFITPA